MVKNPAPMVQDFLLFMWYKLHSGGKWWIVGEKGETVGCSWVNIVIP